MIRDFLTELRPRTFADFVGNRSVVSALQRMLTQNRLPSAVLITGEPGSGKTTLATIISRALSCENWETGKSEPCGNCKPCGWGRTGAYPYNGFHVAPGAKPSEKSFRAALTDVENGVMLWSNSRRAVMTVDDIESLPASYQRILRGRLDNSWACGNLVATSAEPDLIDGPLRQRLVEYQVWAPEEHEMTAWCSRVLTARLGMVVADPEAVTLLTQLGDMNFRATLKITHALVASGGGDIDTEAVRLAAVECGYGFRR